MNKTIALSSLLIGLMINASALADRGWKHRGEHTDIAKVVAVKPIYETIEVARPEQQCWKEKVHRRHTVQYERHNNSHTGTIAGAILGGVIGNQFGHGSGKDAMTVAGTLLGASIGNDISKQGRSSHHHQSSPRFERRCETVTHYDEREELVGYKVKYRYKGEIYKTRMDYDPGDTIRVRVKVDPVF